jgi:hypothetical protein
MINNKYILIVALVLLIPLTIAWTFNHINPWMSFGLIFLILLTVNQLLKTNKNKLNDKN